MSQLSRFEVPFPSILLLDFYLGNSNTTTNLEGSDFENRKEEITRQLVDAAENTGFFTLVDHALSVEEIEAQFAISKSFFALPSEVKRKTKHDPKTALGYENKASRSFTLQLVLECT